MRFLRISLAGCVVEIALLGQAGQKALLKTYRPFVCRAKDKKAVSRITVRNLIPAAQFAKNVLSLGESWSFSRRGRSYCLELENREEGRVATTNRAVFSPDFSSATLYQRPQAVRLSPLAFPIDQIFFSHLLALHSGIVLHACGVSYGHGGLLFLGPSGAGKSTLGKIFLRSKRHAVEILNDDKVAARREGNRFFIYGTPWHGTLRRISPARAEFKSIFFLKKSRQNKILPLSRAEAGARLASLAFLPYCDKRFVRKGLGVVAGLVRFCPAFELSFYPDENVIEFVEEALNSRCPA